MNFDGPAAKLVSLAAKLVGLFFEAFPLLAETAKIAVELPITEGGGGILGGLALDDHGLKFLGLVVEEAAILVVADGRLVGGWRCVAVIVLASIVAARARGGIVRVGVEPVVGACFYCVIPLFHRIRGGRGARLGGGLLGGGLLGGGFFGGRFLATVAGVGLDGLLEAGNGSASLPFIEEAIEGSEMMGLTPQGPGLLEL